MAVRSLFSLVSFAIRNGIELLKVLRGGHTYTQLFGAIFLGFAAGMTPGLNATVVLLFMLFLFLNVNGMLFALSYSLGLICKLALAPVTHGIGQWMMRETPYAEFVTYASTKPVLALMDLHVYALAGSVPIMLIGGLLLAMLGAGLLRRVGSVIEYGSEADAKLAKLLEKPAIGSLLRFILDEREGIDQAYQYPGLFAVMRIFGALCAFVIISVIYMFTADRIAKRSIEIALSSIAQSEVNVSSVDVSLIFGSLHVKDLLIADPQKPEFNIFDAYRISADLSLYELLRGRVVLDDVSVFRAAMDTPRTQAAAEAQERERKGLSLPSTEFRMGDVRAYYDYIQALKQRAEDFKGWLKRYEQVAPTAIDRMEAEQGTSPEVIRLLRDANYDLLAPHAAWVVKSLRLEEVTLIPGFPVFTVAAEHLSSHPSYYGQMPTFKADVDPKSLKEFQQNMLDRYKGRIDRNVEGLRDRLRGLF